MFLFALPQYRDPNAGPTVDLARVTHHSVTEVRHAFALQGIELGGSTHFANVTMLGTLAPPWPTSDLYVFVGAARGTANWGARDEHAYEARFDNLFVHDGSDDPHEFAAVRAAVAALR
jgi:hypothetical protein